MKFTLSWLKDHLDTTADAEAVAAVLNRIGLEVEGIDDKAKALAPYVIARVISAVQHPNADRLRVCMVDTGDGNPIQVVCGAPNARAGMTSVFAPPGTYIPGKNITLGKGVIRGVESNGMLCSEAELELSEDHDGIIDLPEDAPVGTAYASWAKLDDAVIEIAVTPNRPDALGIAGIARDLAAAGLGRLNTPPVATIPGEGFCPVEVSLDFAEDDAHLAPAFALRLVRGVKNGPSPDWLQKRLKAIGLRPINALVDITNYITFDRGRPLHVFDAAKVSGNLVVRRAQDGEEILALDGKTYKLDNGMVVIADDKGVESLAGVMGGEASGCDEGTTDVLIESALWDALNIAQTGRKLGIITDARYRFERGVDPAFTLPGIELATRLVLDLCGGVPSEVTLAGVIRDSHTPVRFPWSEVKRLSGLDLPQAEMETHLVALGFDVDNQGDTALVAAPSWRPDIEGKADLAEEIIRIAGLDRVASTPFPRLHATVAAPVLTLLQKRTRLAKRTLAARGLVEAVTWSFISHDEAVLFGGGDARLALANPIAADLSDMRPNLIPGLVKALQRNADRGFADVALFEVGQVFASDEPEGQTITAVAVRRGTAHAAGTGRRWDAEAKPVDAFDAKGDAFGLMTALGIATAGVQVVAGGPAWYHPGRSATLQFGPKAVIGAFGELHPRILAALDAKGPIVACEITLDLLPPPKAKPTKVKPKLSLPDFQPVTRDFAFVVETGVAAADILKAAQGAERNLIADTSVFDIYEGAGVGEGKKSVAVAVVLQPTEKTLTDQDIEAVSAKIVAAVAKKTGATLRG
ncbi:phenylalanine--tRNA ligase subunit beta [Chelatococcus asaccharovorans]|uniref:phenylalanine--tRNA ligase subunit beta n=1 Tax=Chelatococcus asaccharovorans TaxID=28210 RepID=UPI00224C6BBD|nr:phenylalanine--tRNA ligase subunit beta [Chelatococcus asaccharovorans]CAH1650578.1 Phenylalanine--tRNA ligase beta subunit [Chelatococcus asaccharovorans]CAH1686744.1 Phenylalanine--tRNA ligase beta subunit [Chelatococcus asaccharovorans]